MLRFVVITALSMSGAAAQATAYRATGCLRSDAGLVRLSASPAFPTIGGLFHVGARPVPVHPGIGARAILFVGWTSDRVHVTGLPIPVDLQALNLQGIGRCLLLSSCIAGVLPSSSAHDTVVWMFHIPNDPAMRGHRLMFQALVEDDSPNTVLGWTFTDTAIEAPLN